MGACLAVIGLVAAVWDPVLAVAHDAMAHEQEGISIGFALSVIGFSLIVLLAIRRRPRRRNYRQSPPPTQWKK